MKKPKAKCPVCGQPGKPAGKSGTRDRFQCPLGHLFDADPNEGGTHHQRDPSRRLSNQEELNQARAANDLKRAEASKPFRFR